MRIVKKDRIDVKKFMDDMKANRTKRTFTSLEERNTRPADRISQERNPNQYDNYSNHSIPLYSRPTSYRNEPYYDNHYNIFQQLDLLSQNSQNYRPPLNQPVQNIQPPQNMFYNQINPYFGGSQFPASQYMYPGFNNSNQMSNFDFSKRTSYVQQPPPQPTIIDDSQDPLKFNSKVKSLPENPDKMPENTPNNQHLTRDEKQTPKTDQMMDIETQKMPLKSTEEETATKISSKLQRPSEGKKEESNPLEKSKEEKVVEVKKEQTLVKKRNARRKKTEKEMTETAKEPENTELKQEQKHLQTEVNKSFEEMLERERRAVRQKEEGSEVYKSIFTFLDSQIKEEFKGTNWKSLREELGKASAKADTVKLGDSAMEMKREVGNALAWLEKLTSKLHR